MDLRKKKILLMTAESISNMIVKEQAQSAIPKVLNAISIVAKNNPNSTDKNEIIKILKEFKKLPFGGNNEKIGFDKVVRNIEINDIFRTRQGSLNMSEVEYVFAWVRRIVKENRSKDI